MVERHKVAVTGASGFVGRALVEALAGDERFSCRARYRSPPSFQVPAEIFVAGDVAESWDAALRGADMVVHTIARTHVLRETAPDALAEYRRVNVAGTTMLARRAAEAGVRRFVFLSSIKVNGESTPADRPFRETDAPAPIDAYGVSKLEAERALQALAEETGLEVVVLRPPLVYGPGVKGNLARLMRLVRARFPLPLGAVRNRRSMVGLDNLVSAIIACLVAQNAAGQTYLVSDQHDLSTAELVALMARSMEHRANLWPVPLLLLRLAGRLAGRSDEVQRLVGSLRVDSSRLSDELGWAPHVPVEEGIRRMVAAFRQDQ